MCCLGNSQRFFSLTAVHSEADVLVKVRNIIQKLSPCTFKSWGGEQPKWWTQTVHKTSEMWLELWALKQKSLNHAGKWSRIFLRMLQYTHCLWKNYSMPYFLLPHIFILPDGTWEKTMECSALWYSKSAGDHVILHIPDLECLSRV